MGFRIAIGRGRCSDGLMSADPYARQLCERIRDRIASLRLLSHQELRSLAQVTTECEQIGNREVLLSVFRDELESGLFLVVVQGFVPSWRFPRYFGAAGIGHMYAEGLVISANGAICPAEDEIMWGFR